MTDIPMCPACKRDTDSGCYCPGVPLNALQRPLRPDPVPPYVEPYRYTSAQIHETCQPALLAASRADHWAGERAYYLREIARLRAETGRQPPLAARDPAQEYPDLPVRYRNALWRADLRRADVARMRNWELALVRNVGRRAIATIRAVIPYQPPSDAACTPDAAGRLTLRTRPADPPTGTYCPAYGMTACRYGARCLAADRGEGFDAS
jgi:hypothetical protein